MQRGYARLSSFTTITFFFYKINTTITKFNNESMCQLTIKLKENKIIRDSP